MMGPEMFQRFVAWLGIVATGISDKPSVKLTLQAYAETIAYAQTIRVLLFPPTTPTITTKWTEADTAMTYFGNSTVLYEDMPLGTTDLVTYVEMEPSSTADVIEWLGVLHIFMAFFIFGVWVYKKRFARGHHHLADAPPTPTIVLSLTGIKTIDTAPELPVAAKSVLSLTGIKTTIDTAPELPVADNTVLSLAAIKTTINTTPIESCLVGASLTLSSVIPVHSIAPSSTATFNFADNITFSPASPAPLSTTTAANIATAAAVAAAAEAELEALKKQAKKFDSDITLQKLVNSSLKATWASLPKNKPEPLPVVPSPFSFGNTATSFGPVSAPPSPAAEVDKARQKISNNVIAQLKNELKSIQADNARLKRLANLEDQLTQFTAVRDGISFTANTRQPGDPIPSPTTFPGYDQKTRKEKLNLKAKWSRWKTADGKYLAKLKAELAELKRVFAYPEPEEGEEELQKEEEENEEEENEEEENEEEENEEEENEEEEDDEEEEEQEEEQE